MYPASARAGDPGPRGRPGGILAELGELELEDRIVVPAEEAEEQPVGQLEWATAPGIAELEESAILGDRADLLDPLLRRRRQGEQIATPDARVLLLLDHRLGELRVDHQIGRAS